MASSRPLEPVLHCRKDRPKEVSRLAARLLKGLYANAGKFPNPTVDKTLFETEKEALDRLLRYKIGDSDAVKLCNAKASEVHALCKLLLIFVKPICNSDIDLILLTGFDPNHQPRKHQIPTQRIIHKIVRTGALNQYKLLLTKMQTGTDVTPDPATHQRDVRYTVELTLTPDDPKSWGKVCVSAPSNRLIFDEVFPGQKNYVRVYGTNAAGNGMRSLERYFTPEIP